MNNTGYIVFDFDGTIADTMSEMVKIYNENHQKFKVKPVSEEELASLRAQGPREIMKALDISIFKLPGIVFKLKKELKKRIAQVSPFNNIELLLKRLKEQGYRLNILSSNSQENIRAFLEHNRLNYFDCIYSASNLFGKDRALLKMIKMLRIAKEELIYIGDEVRDIEATKKTGLPMIAVSWGYNTGKTLERYHPEYLVNTIEDIVEILI